MTKKPAPLPPAHDLGLAECLKTFNGRAVLWDLLEGHGCFRMSAVLNGDPLAPYATYFREGERNRGNQLLARIQAADIDGYLKMQREAYLRKSQGDDDTERRRAAEHGPAVGSDDDGDADAS